MKSSNLPDRLFFEPGNGAPTPEPGGIDNNLHKRENNSVVLVKVGEQMKKNENVENYESWSIEIIEQQKRHSDMLTCALVISLIVNVILVAILAVVVKG